MQRLRTANKYFLHVVGILVYRFNVVWDETYATAWNGSILGISKHRNNSLYFISVTLFDF